MLLLSGKLSGVHKLGENFREGTSRISKSSGKKDIGNSSKMLATLSFAQNQCIGKGERGKGNSSKMLATLSFAQNQCLAKGETYLHMYNLFTTLFRPVRENCKGLQHYGN